jgi:hypothetical protein
MTKPPSPAKAVLRKFNGAGAADGGQAGDGAVDGDQAGAGAARAGTAADGVGAKAGARPLASDMDLDTPVGATEAGVMAVVAVVAVAAMEAAAAGKLNLTRSTRL